MFEVISFESDRKRKSDGKIREDSQDPVGHGTLDTESGAVSYLVNTWKKGFISEYAVQAFVCRFHLEGFLHRSFWKVDQKF